MHSAASETAPTDRHTCAPCDWTAIKQQIRYYRLCVNIERHHILAELLCIIRYCYLHCATAPACSQLCMYIVYVSIVSAVSTHTDPNHPVHFRSPVHQQQASHNACSIALYCQAVFTVIYLDKRHPAWTAVILFCPNQQPSVQNLDRIAPMQESYHKATPDSLLIEGLFWHRSHTKAESAAVDITKMRECEVKHW